MAYSVKKVVRLQLFLKGDNCNFFYFKKIKILECFCYMRNDRKDYTAMTEKELRRLSRMDLLEMLLEQSREVERLQKELETVKNQLSDRRIMEQEAGSIAEASLKLNKVFEAAQQAADQYLENIRIRSEISQNGETENEAE